MATKIFCDWCTQEMKDRIGTIKIKATDYTNEYGYTDTHMIDHDDVCQDCNKKLIEFVKSL